MSGKIPKTPRGWNNLALRSIGERVRVERASRQIERSTLAEKAGIHYDALLKIETGHRSPSLRTLVSLANSLEIRVTDLLSGSELVTGGGGE